MRCRRVGLNAIPSNGSVFGTNGLVGTAAVGVLFLITVMSSKTLLGLSAS